MTWRTSCGNSGSAVIGQRTVGMAAWVFPSDTQTDLGARFVPFGLSDPCIPSNSAATHRVAFPQFTFSLNSEKVKKLLQLYMPAPSAGIYVLGSGG